MCGQKLSVSKAILLLTLAILVKTEEEVSIPSFIKVCHKSDPELNKCVKKSVELLRPYFSIGIPELGIPSCEPLNIPEVVINQGKGAVNIKSTYTDIKVFGPSKFVLQSVKVEPERDRVRIKLWLPYLHMTSDYKLEGRILMLPISGNGFSEGNYTDIEATCTIQGEKRNRNGQVYFHVKDFFIDFDIGHAKVFLDDLFDGDEELGQAMNLFLNDNWKNVADEIKPVLEETIGELFRKFSNKIYHKFPLDLLLPD